MRQIAFLMLPAMAAAPLAASAQSVDEVFEGLIRAENAGLDTVDNYVIRTELMGFATVEYFEKAGQMQLDNGDTVYVMRNVPLSEMQERQSPDSPIANASPEELRNAADMIEQQGAAMEQGMRQEQGGNIFAEMLMNPPPDQPWLSGNPRDMTSMYALMLRGAADGKEARAAEDPEGDQARRLTEMQQMMTQTEIIGRETIDGRPAIGLAADDLGYTQADGGEEFTLDTVTMWVDAERYVPLRMKMDGIMRIEGESRPITIERDDLDYRSVPGCGEMYKPARSIMRLGGMLTPEQEAQMADAQEQLAEVEEQLAAMPESQRELIMRQMGPQMEMLQNMMAGNGISIETRVTEMRCNTGMPGAMEMAMTTMTGGAFGGGIAGVGAGAAGGLPDTRTGESAGGAAGNAGENSAGGTAGSAAGSTAGSAGGVTAGEAAGEAAGGVFGGAAGGIAGAVGGLFGGGRRGDRTEPYYVDEEGVGVIRYEGDAREYFLEIKHQGELFAGPLGPYEGPDVGIFVGSLNAMGVPLEELRIEIYEENPRRLVETFEPVVNARRAESEEDCGTVSALGACSD